MITEIGIAAGDIWHYLDQHQKSTLAAVVKGIGKSREVVLMSVGWLAREGHVVVEKMPKDYEIWLRK